MITMNKIITTLFVALISTVSLNAYSEHQGENEVVGGVEKLSPELRALLKQEMQAIQQGMQQMVPAFVSGDLEEVSAIAGNIKSSFIMKQKITSAQKHELHKKLPKDFIAKDQQFHKYAGMLEHVSEEGHTELVSFYYSKMLESCVGCHSAHATHRFPLLKNVPAKNGSEHHASEKNGHHH